MISAGHERTLAIYPAKRSDVADFSSHIVRHLAESGRNGRIHFAPVSEVSRDDVMRESERRWMTPLTHPGWGRVWLLADEDRPAAWRDEGRVVGHVELRGSVVHAGLHRADLSIGLEERVRGGGWGKRLTEVAIAFAREQSQLEFLDLRVLAHNERAIRLYTGFGFTRVGYVTDAFRFADGTRVDDVLMSMRLRP